MIQCAGVDANRARGARLTARHRARFRFVKRHLLAPRVDGEHGPRVLHGEAVVRRDGAFGAPHAHGVLGERRLRAGNASV